MTGASSGIDPAPRRPLGFVTGQASTCCSLCDQSDRHFGVEHARRHHFSGAAGCPKCQIVSLACAGARNYPDQPIKGVPIRNDDPWRKRRRLLLADYLTQPIWPMRCRPIRYNRSPGCRPPNDVAAVRSNIYTLRYFVGAASKPWQMLKEKMETAASRAMHARRR
jgi:hypothetical protein